jgi:hypothetical protein
MLFYHRVGQLVEHARRTKAGAAFWCAPRSIRCAAARLAPEQESVDRSPHLS